VSVIIRRESKENREGTQVEEHVEKQKGSQRHYHERERERERLAELQQT
jgi:hypothetical protein